MTQKKKQIIEHPDFKKQKYKYQNWENLVIGGDRVEYTVETVGKYGAEFANEYQYLRQHPHETKEQWEIRQWLSTYRNYALPVVSVFSSSVWRKNPLRKLPEILEPYVADVDRQGTNANVFFQNVTVDAAMHGLNYVVVDSPVVPENRTKEYDQKHNIRPYFTSVSVLNVPKWGIITNEISGIIELDYVVIDIFYQDDADAFEESNEVQQYKILYKDKWELYTEIDGALSLTDAGVYKLNEVPIVNAYFKEILPMIGASCIAPVTSLCVHSYRTNNVLDKALYDTAFPMMFLKGFDQPKVDKYVRSSHNGLVGVLDSDVKYVEPSGQSFKDLRDAIKQDVNDIQEIVLRMIRPESKQIQSEPSKKEDRLQLDSQLTMFARNIEQAETQAWHLMLDFLGHPELKNQVIIEYNKDFDPNTIGKELIKEFREMETGGQISKDTLYKVMKKGELLPEDFDPEEEKVLIAAENRDSASLAGLSNTRDNEIDEGGDKDDDE